jgi:hypothetical protein
MKGDHQQRVPLRPGGRVRIALTYHWAQGARGTIMSQPGYPRASTVRGEPTLFYWVWFDEAQYDADGDGPYIGAVIDAGHLESID